METIEYRVRPVTRYVVTRFHREGDTRVAACSSVLGEYDNEKMAYEVAYALCREEHRRLGWPVGDERINYPALPELDASVRGMSPLGATGGDHGAGAVKGVLRP